MDKLKKAQKVQRVSFTKYFKTLEEIVSTENVNRNNVVVPFQMLENKIAELNDLQEKIIDLMLTESSSDEDIQKEITTADEYRVKYLRAKLRVQEITNPFTDPPPIVLQSTVDNTINRKKSHKFPKLEIPKFSGNLRDWLQFWSQFKKIDEDPDVTSDDKFQYLLQAIIPGSRAHDLVQSFPPTGANYSIAIESLKERYGKNDLLIEVYVRELLELVLKNVMKNKEKKSLSSLYDKLETQLRALETLGVTTTNCAAMLFPLVESALPEELLRTWQRTVSNGGEAEAGNRLQALLKFLKSEVQNEERINMAAQGFSLSVEEEKTHKVKTKVENRKDVATAAGLLTMNASKSVECIFCKSNHDATDCETARKLTLERKREIAKEQGYCYNCLRRGHTFTRCRTNVKCAWCTKKHVIVMCPQMRKVDASEKEKSAPTSSISEHNLASMQNSPVVYLQTLRVKVYNGDCEVNVRAIIDTGSQRSYISSALAKKLGYRAINTREVMHSLFGGSKTSAKIHDIFLIHVKSLDGKYACNFKAMNQDIICGEVDSIKSASWIDILKRENIELTDVDSNSTNIDILIGADVAGKLITGRRFDLKNGIIAIDTLLGWTVMGEIKERNIEDSTSLITTSLFVQQADVSELWNLDVVGITDPVLKKNQFEREEDIKTRFFNTVKIDETKRYVVELPWTEDHAPLPSNENIAKRRLINTISKLKAKNIVDDYDKIFKSWEEQGIIETVPEEDLCNFTHYLPHRPVLKKNSSTPIRPVFDASAREKDTPSLNQCLEKGPNLIELMPSVLLRFRMKNIGVISDIQKAFLQIGIASKDRDKLRFLWENLESKRVYRHCRVVFGLSCSPFLLGATIQLHLERASDGKLEGKYSSTTISLLKDSFYVDNCVCSVDTEEELHCFIEEATSLMAEGCFNLRGWEHSDDGDTNSTAVLGMIWNKEDDTLSFNLSFLDDIQPHIVTKKSILSASHRIFDPLGIICPILLCPKLLLQKTWILDIGWDAEVEDGIKDDFINWFKTLSTLKNLRIPRMIGWTNEPDAMSLHTFCDASGSAYAAVVFLRVKTKGRVTVQLLSAKARVAPVKQLTIPRLELLAATIGARLAVSIIETLKCPDIRTYFWSDSTTVLSWIKREAQWNVYVYNRVQEIKKLTDISNWRYVPGECNPADLPSRGCTAERLISSRWWEGPLWLRDEQHWPDFDYSTNEDLINSERKKSALTAMLHCNANESNISSRLWYARYFSNYLKIVRLIGWIFRFVYNSKCSKFSRKDGNLTVDEITKAERSLLKLVQDEMFDSSKDLKLKNFDVFTDDSGLMRIKTKVLNREDLFEFRCPIVLDSKHDLVKILVEYEHQRQHHAGVQILMSSLREKYWIISARRVVRSVVDKCTRCKRYMAKRLEARPSPLPINRVRDAMVFEITGVDCAGPLFLQNNEKAWICLFTCAVYRALHLELITSLSTSCFIEALRRFIARRGRPSIVYSDNGTNFTGFKNACDKLDWNKISEFSSSQQIEWRFNPPSAACWGGWWERLVRSVKQTLRKILGKACVTYEEMTTILCDCESLINSRPLSYVSSDPSDLSPLTPALFLQDVREAGVPDCDNIENCNLKARLLYRQKLKEDIRKRFRIEYLGLLKTRWAATENRNLKVGDLVLVGDDVTKRLDWPLGRVTAVIPGVDGNVRTIKVKTQKTELTRPIQRIYPLELSLSNEKDDSTKVLKAIDPAKAKVNKINQKNDIVSDSDRSINIETKYVNKFGRTVKPPRRFE